MDKAAAEAQPTVSAYLMGRVFYTELTLALKMTLLALADVADDDGTGITLGQARIARKVGCSERTVRRHLDDLRKYGYVQKIGRVGARGQDRHSIVVEALPTHEQIAMMFPRPATDARPANLADRPPTATSTGHLASVDRTPMSADSSVDSSVDSTPPLAASAEPDPGHFDADKWRFLLDKLHTAGWTAEGSGALTWRFLMKLRQTYGSRVVDSALSDATYNDTAPAMSSAAYLESICVRYRAELEGIGA